MRQHLTMSCSTWCATALLSALPSCVLVGYGAELDALDGADLASRQVAASDAGAMTGAEASISQPSQPDALWDAGVSWDASLLIAALADSAADFVSVDGCGWNETCSPTCKSGTCSVSCAESAWCTTTCEPGTRCSINCSGGGVCDMDCQGGASCDVDCRGTLNCGFLECAQGASCVLRCADNLLGCSLRCHGVAMICANNVHVCDAPCPG